jgi:hypothetical protein
MDGAPRVLGKSSFAIARPQLTRASCGLGEKLDQRAIDFVGMRPPDVVRAAVDAARRISPNRSGSRSAVAAIGRILEQDIQIRGEGVVLVPTMGARPEDRSRDLPLDNAALLSRSRRRRTLRRLHLCLVTSPGLT